MKLKLVNKLFAATAVSFVFANASMTANAEELSKESAVISDPGGYEQVEEGSGNDAGQVETPDEETGAEQEEQTPEKELTFEEASENLEQAKAEEAEAKSELDSAKSEADAAQTEADKAQQEAEDAASGLDEAQEKKEEAEIKKEETDKKAEQTGQTLDEAEKALDEALQGGNISIEDYEKAKAELDKKKAQQETAQEAVDAAASDCNEKKDEADEAAAEAGAAQEAVGEAEKDKEAADQAVSSAQKEVEDAKQAYEDALGQENSYEKELREAEERLKAAQEKVASGSLGFFQDMEAQGSESAGKAVTVLTAKDTSEIDVGSHGIRDEECSKTGGWENFISYTHLGEKNDATSLESMRAAFEHIKRCNELRLTDEHFGADCSELQVNDVLMAIAQLNANWAANVVMVHSSIFNAGENLAWNYGSDPYKQWYDGEKVKYDAGTTDFSTVGHYLNITDKDYMSTGYAINPNGSQWPYAYAQEFAVDTTTWYLGYGESYSVEVYESRFMSYYNAVMQELADAQKAYEAAKAAYDAAGGQGNQALIDAKKKELDSAEAKLETAKAEAEKKMGVLSEMQEILTEKEAASESAQAVYEQSAQKLEEAQQGLEAAKAAYEAALKDINDTFGTEIADAVENLEQSRAEHKQAQEAQEKAAAEFSEMEALLAKAEERNAEAGINLQEKLEVLAQKRQVLEEAKSAYAEASEKLAAAQEEYDRLKPQPTEDKEVQTARSERAKRNTGSLLINDSVESNCRGILFLENSSFKYFLGNISNHIKECPFGSLLIDCSRVPWFSINKDTLEALKNNRNRNLTIIFRYEGRKYTFTIPSDYDLDLLQDSNGWYGFMYLKMVFGGYEIVE